MSRQSFPRLRPIRFAGLLIADQRGVTALVTGFALTVVLGFAGLAVDVAVWLNASRGMQAAADQAAYSAAEAAGTQGCASTTAPTQATGVAAARGYKNGVNSTTVSLTCDSSKSTFTVAISQTQPMWFANLFLSTAPTASATATAQLAGKVSDLCILALDGSNPSAGVTGSDASVFSMNGGTSLNVHCGVAVDSSNISGLNTGGSSALTATDLYLVGDMQGSPSGSSTVTTTPTANNILKNQLALQDPYAGRVIPSYSCSSYSMTQLDSGTLDPAVKSVYCGGLSIGGSSPSTITVKAGTYIIAGGSLTFNSKATVADDNNGGVTFILTGDSTHGYASLTINGGPQSSVHLSAPTTGSTGGLVFFQDRNAPPSSTTGCGSGTSQNQINGGSNQLLTGAVYFPNQSVCYGGGASTSGAGKCTQLIARTLTFTGNSEVQSVCAGTGIEPISVLTPSLIK